MKDVRLFQTNDGGEIAIVNGQAVTADGLETAVYLSLFGGNEDDNGVDADNPAQWWGNFLETDPAYMYRSRTQNLIAGLAATDANLLRVEDAANADVAWLADIEVANDVTVEATAPGFNQLQLTVNVEIGDAVYEFVFERDWGTE